MALDHQSQSSASAHPVFAKTPRLTRQEWDMVLQAPGAYRHNTQFRDLCERIEEAL